MTGCQIESNRELELGKWLYEMWKTALEHAQSENKSDTDLT
jgi:hypothetical protein